ncbi:MAG: methyltransferase domain-containing protein [Acidobacteria bacterium]|nr:methyltransferase domain-containing protein [Acidobacteriota bacterium]MCA1627890.1 methyltransferase domain-containing protein [Acidobacteriota bacterium]
MKLRLIQYLACPNCGGEIRVSQTVSEDGPEILEGTLECSACAKQFPIIGGVPRFADLESVEPEKAATASSFGFEWKHFTQEDERYGDQFLGWITPVTPEFFKDKVVLDGGCGKGRHMLLAASWGARDVVGVDLSDAVESAFATTRESHNMHVVQADIYRLPLKQAFDYAYSIGVLDHIPDPFVGFKSLALKVKPGGHVSVWVYGAENNGWIINLVNPVRERFTSRIHPRALLHLSKLPTAAVYAVSKLLLRPLSKLPLGSSLVDRLFYGQYLTYISRFGWREQHTIVFDHLVAPTAHYIRRDDFEQWWREIGAEETVIGWHNKNSWRGFGKMNGNGSERVI